MKKIIVLAVALMLVASGVAMAIVNGSKHDLSAATNPANSGTKSSCEYCHTPHHAYTNSAPLWNKTFSGATYTVYGGGTTGTTLSGTTVNQPGANSKTCLSCHDGTLSVGDTISGGAEIITGPGLTGGKMTDTFYEFGTDLTKEHPVGVVYDSTKATSLAGLIAIQGSGGNPIVKNGKKWKVYGVSGGPWTVECGSCHDPHNTTAGQTPFLKDTLNTICGDCHGNK